ncbi:MAG: LysR family transcriptional regulator [Bdellovibrionales bacterium]
MNSSKESLKLLSVCINYRNLTAASKHVGLSQPQLSRIVKALEEDLGIVLLDRSSPRHSTWTPQARGVAEIYMKAERSLEADLDSYLEGSLQKNVKIGCLEGLASLGVDAAAELLNHTHVERVIVNLYDLNQLEAKFSSLDLDLAFTSRAPVNKKLTYEKHIGSQTLFKERDKESKFKILSSYEDLGGKPKKKEVSKKIVSNSLAVRRLFKNKYGGEVLLPSEVKYGKELGKDSVSVLLLGQDHISKIIWNRLSKNF